MIVLRKSKKILKKIDNFKVTVFKSYIPHITDFDWIDLKKDINFNKEKIWSDVIFLRSPSNIEVYWYILWKRSNLLEDINEIENLLRRYKLKKARKIYST